MWYQGMEFNKFSVYKEKETLKLIETTLKVSKKYFGYPGFEVMSTERTTIRHEASLLKFLGETNK